MSDSLAPGSRGSGRLLQTKLMPPRLPDTIIPRPDLLARLDEGLSRMLILVKAPTGFGKSTLVASWADAGNFSSAWVTLDPNDNDPVRFWTYTITALRSIDASLGKNSLSALLTSQPVSLQATLTPLINDLARLSRTSVLVLEDYQAITSAEVGSTVSILLQNLPPELHLVLISRREPEFPLGIWRARDELIELDAASLRFGLEETATFLDRIVPTELPPSAVAKLHERTEGWAAGLRLAARALQNMGDDDSLDRFTQTFSGSQPYVSDYLIQEVFSSQPEPVQNFLLKTCFLSRLTGSLCDAVTGATGGAAVLEQLERENLFIVQLRDHGARTWYRYHALFAESIQAFARRRLGEAGVQSVYENATGWFESHGLNEEAIETALNAGLFERALRLIENYVEIHGLAESYTLGRWLERIPSEEIYQHPQVCFVQAQVILYTSDRFAPATAARLEPLLQAAEKAWLATERVGRLGALHALQGQVAWWQGDAQTAFEYARQALGEIPEQEVLYRGISLLIVSAEALNAGRIFEAQDHILEARALLGAAQNVYGVLAASQMLGEVFYWQGELEQADQINQQVLVEAVEASGGESMLDDQGIASLGLANAAYERNDLSEAEPLAARALDLAWRRSNQQLQIQATLRLADIQAARGELNGARQSLISLAAGVQNPAWLREVRSAQALLAIRANELSSLDGWLAVIAAEQEDILLVQKEREAVTLARWQIASGKPEEALETLAGWQDDAAQQGRVRSQVEALCLTALAHEANAGRSLAAGALTLALQLGRSKGFRRLFLDEGPRLAALLQTIAPDLPNQGLRVYATSLLQSFSQELDTDRPVGEAGFLVAPLSPQETRVLRLLAGGLTNAEIAAELIVSRNTIKSQVQSIYRKLNVHSRQEASLVARELGLL
jgi:LuxR family maltose regulon positive regulatory protein